MAAKKRRPSTASAKRRGAAELARIYGVDLITGGIIGKSKYKILRRTGLVCSSLVAIGHELNMIKAMLPHGLFRPFVINEFSFSPRKAQIWMNCATISQGNLDIINRFQATTLYKLAAPTTPTSIRDRVFADVREGQECPPLKTIKLQIEQARETKSPVQVVEVSADNPYLNFGLGVEALNKASDAGLSKAGMGLLSLFAANIPRKDLGTTAGLLEMVCHSDLPKMASKMRFKVLYSAQLSQSDAELEATFAVGA
jgi:hypothetical protein